MSTYNEYNAAADLIERNLPHRANKTAFIDDQGSITFEDLSLKIDRFAGYLTSLGLPVETRVMLCLADNIDFVAACLGSIKAGLVPVMINPLLTASDFDYLLGDSRSRMLIVSEAAWPAFAGVVGNHAALDHILIAANEAPEGVTRLAEAMSYPHPRAETARTRLDEPCLWQYSSGSTGRPKGTIHSHANVRNLINAYPKQILLLTEADVTFSAAKLFFGYGFGNSLVFPLSVGATSILMAERPTVLPIWQRLVEHKVSVFYGVPTLYNSLLSHDGAPNREQLSLRLCTSAGEALPADLGRRWKSRFGSDILDGIGSTEMFHIFLSNRISDVAYGTTGRPLDGYELQLIGEDGREVAQGEVGELRIKGPTSALGYWCNREKTQATFLGPWTRSGDNFMQDADGRYVYCGRSDDMLKVSGIYVSPFEVESALNDHALVLEAAVVGWADEAGLIKPKAFVVLHEACDDPEAVAAELRLHVKAALAPYKYPRWIEFVEALPKTATGKIERYKLRSSIG